MKSVGHVLDPSKFTVAPKVAIIDEFEMTGDDGSFVAHIDRDWIAKCVEQMNRRETTTGDLCPGVIGHTIDGAAEVAQPPVTAYLRNWVQDEFFNTGRTAAFADIWVYNDDVETVRKYPRRSGEVWVNKHEIDPLSFLGATTPARDLGMLMLNRGGDLVIQKESPQMPEPEKKPDTDKEAGGMKELKALLEQILAAVTANAAPKGEPAPAEGAPQGGDGDISDEELEKLLASGDQDGAPSDDMGSRKAEPKPEKEMGYPGGDDTHIKCSRAEWDKMQADLAQARTDIAKSDIRTQLVKLARLGHIGVDPEDAALVDDLAAMPPEMRARQLERMKLSRKDNSRGSYTVDSALSAAVDGEPKRMTPADRDRIIKLAREKNVQFEAAAAAEGYTLTRN